MQARMDFTLQLSSQIHTIFDPVCFKGFLRGNAWMDGHYFSVTYETHASIGKKLSECYSWKRDTSVIRGRTFGTCRHDDVGEANRIMLDIPLSMAPVSRVLLLLVIRVQALVAQCFILHSEYTDDNNNPLHEYVHSLSSTRRLQFASG
jgi:hypothetical protein